MNLLCMHAWPDMCFCMLLLDIDRVYSVVYCSVYTMEQLSGESAKVFPGKILLNTECSGGILCMFFSSSGYSYLFLRK